MATQQKPKNQDVLLVLMEKICLMKSVSINLVQFVDIGRVGWSSLLSYFPPTTESVKFITMYTLFRKACCRN